VDVIKKSITLRKTVTEEWTVGVQAVGVHLKGRANNLPCGLFVVGDQEIESAEKVSDNPR